MVYLTLYSPSPIFLTGNPLFILALCGLLICVRITTAPRVSGDKPCLPQATGEELDSQLPSEAKGV